MMIDVSVYDSQQLCRCLLDTCQATSAFRQTVSRKTKQQDLIEQNKFSEILNAGNLFVETLFNNELENFDFETTATEVDTCSNGDLQEDVASRDRTLLETDLKSIIKMEPPEKMEATDLKNVQVVICDIDANQQYIKHPTKNTPMKVKVPRIDSEMEKDHGIIKAAASVKKLPRKKYRKRQKVPMTKEEKKEAKKQLCSECGLQCPSRYVLLNHIRSKHTHDKPFACNWCSKRYTTRNSLRTHITDVHEHKQYICNSCGKIFSTNGSLLKHEKRQHLGKEKPFVCLHCTRSFHEIRLLQAHMSVHSNLRPHTCDFCGKTYKRVEHLKSHERIHDKRRTCLVCNEEFPSASFLKMHEESAHLPENAVVHVCSICDCAFATTNTLAVHKRLVHSIVCKAAQEQAGFVQIIEDGLDPLMISEVVLDVNSYTCTE